MEKTIVNKVTVLKHFFLFFPTPLFSFTFFSFSVKATTWIYLLFPPQLYMSAVQMSELTLQTSFTNQREKLWCSSQSAVGTMKVPISFLTIQGILELQSSYKSLSLER